VSLQALPFKTAPITRKTVVGNAQVGTLEFPAYSGLTVAETNWLQQSGASKTAFAFTAKAALKIAKAEKVKPIDAHQFVAKVLAGGIGADVQFSPEEENWQVKYLTDLEYAATMVVEISVSNQISLVTTVIRHRLEGQSEWDIAATQTLPQALVDEIYQFALSEQAGGVVVDENTIREDLAEALGKSKTAPTKKRKRSTGRKSSTNSDSSTQETQILPQNDLAAS